MSLKLQEHIRLSNRYINEVLPYVWDPIGVAGMPQTRDEYDSYVPGVFKLVEGGANKNEIAVQFYKIGRKVWCMSRSADSIKKLE